jgi:hypothetical protein
VVPLVAHGWIVRQRGRRRVHLSTSLAPSLSFAACKFPSEWRLKTQETIGRLPASSSRNDALAHGVEDEFWDAVDVELLQDMAPMSFDGG